MRIRPLLLTGLCMAAGCAHEQVGLGRLPVPSAAVPGQNTAHADALWDELRKSAITPAEGGDDAAYINAPKAPAVSLTCQLPLNAPTDRAWALTDEDVLPADLRALWNANGLRIGMLREAKWEAFRGALNRQEKNAPAHAGVTVQNRAAFAVRPFPEPLHRGGALPRGLQLPLDRTLPPLAPKITLMETFAGDRLQLLGQAAFLNGKLDTLTLTPHLHRPAPVLVIDPEKGPPKAWEKEIQGQLISALAAQIRPRAGELIVVGFHRPWAMELPPETAAGNANPGGPSGEKTAPKTGEKDGPPADPGEALVLSATPPPLTLTLGRALFTAFRDGTEVQVLLVIGTK